jgi:hypothetical protein
MFSKTQNGQKIGLGREPFPDGLSGRTGPYLAHYDNDFPAAAVVQIDHGGKL